MALSANTQVVEILRDTHTTLLTKVSYYSAGTSDQASNLVINVATLQFRTMILTGTLANPTAPISLIPGEVVTAVDGCAGYVVQHWTPNTTHFIARVMLANSAAQFSNNDVLTGDRSNNAFTVGAAGAVSEQAILGLAAAWWSVTGAAATSVGIEFDNANTSLTDEAVRVAGTGYFGKNNLPELILPALATRTVNSSIGATGNIDISTYGIAAKGGYTLVLEFRKVAGFAGRPVY